MIDVRFSGGFSGHFVAWTGEHLVVASPAAFAPGAPIHLTLAMPDGELSVELRSMGSKKREDGLFDVRGRTINLKRQDKERLDSLTA